MPDIEPVLLEVWKGAGGMVRVELARYGDLYSQISFKRNL